MSLFAPAVLGWLALQSSAPASRAADRDLLASVMPPGAVAYVEVPRPAELWSAVRELGLDERVTALPVVDRVLNGPTAMVLAAVRNVLGGDIAGSLLAASDGGVAVALVPSPSKRALASVLAVRSRDPVALARARDGVARLGGLRVDGAWDESRVETTRHGDVEIISTRNSRHHAIAGEWLLASDDRAQLVEALDRRRSAKSGSLAEQPRFAQARSGANDGPTAAFAWVDVDGFATLRPELRDSAKTLEPIPALLFGGLRRAAIGAPWIAARMSLDVAAPGAVRLSMQSGASFEGLEAERAVFLPERTPAAVLDAPRAIATLTLRRDGASFWNHRDALVAPELDADFARFNSFVGLVFGARNVDEDVLPKLHPIAQLVAARQTYAGMAAAP
ncbi:MAG TPA: hypothetical protein VKE69_02890, partial [Planctomycetota bacterium]|nr:hypothetical protein [Planctomycetota bacterium]